MEDRPELLVVGIEQVVEAIAEFERDAPAYLSGCSS
jgi:hypothetical protein